MLDRAPTAEMQANDEAPRRVRQIVPVAIPRSERGAETVRGQLQALQDELWSLIRNEAIDAEREVQHA